MKIDILTLFPEMFVPVIGGSILGRAAEKGILDIRLTNIRDFSNDTHNKGDLTPFIMMFTDIIRESLYQLEQALVKRYEQLSHYQKCMMYLPYGMTPKYAQIYYLLIQASLFAENGISTQELMEATDTSRTTMANRLKLLSDNNLIIKESMGNIRCYKLDLSVVDEIYKRNSEI